MEASTKIKCPAKINLSLDVIGRRDDGYHRLETVMHTVDPCDILTVSYKAQANTVISVSSDSALIPSDGSNLCAKAAELFLLKTGLCAKVEIHIKKTIPVGAGLGGGSSDAAGTLLALNKLSGKQLSAEALSAIAKDIGADVPFFIHGGCMLAEGIGEILSPLPRLCGVSILIAKPDFGISTPYAYRKLDLSGEARHPDTKSVIKALNEGKLSLLAQSAENVFELPIATEFPEILRYKSLMLSHGALYSLMSGSGSSVFGIFNDPLKAKNAFDIFKDITKNIFLSTTEAR